MSCNVPQVWLSGTGRKCESYTSTECVVWSLPAFRLQQRSRYSSWDDWKRLSLAESAFCGGLHSEDSFQWGHWTGLFSSPLSPTCWSSCRQGIFYLLADSSIYLNPTMRTKRSTVHIFIAVDNVVIVAVTTWRRRVDIIVGVDTCWQSLQRGRSDTAAISWVVTPVVSRVSIYQWSKW